MTRTRALTALSIWVVLCASLWATQARPAVIALAGVVALGVALVVSVLDGTRVNGDNGWSHRDMRDRPTEGDLWTIQMRHQLSGARMTGSIELHNRLVSLVEYRQAVDQPLTPILRDLLTGPPRRLGSRRTLEQTITDIEAL